MKMVSVAVRNRHGELTGRCERLAIDDWIDLECNLSFRPLQRGAVQINGYPFFVDSYGTWVGSMAYDAFSVTDTMAAAILNYVRKADRNATPVEAEVTLWDKWESGAEYTADDFSEVEH